MAIQVSDACRNLDAYPSGKSVLMAMADRARPDGTRIFPSVEWLMKATSQKRRTVQRALSVFRRERIIRLDRKAQPKRPAEYSIDLKVVDECVTSGKKITIGATAESGASDNNVSRGATFDGGASGNIISTSASVTPEPSLRIYVPNGTGAEPPSQGVVIDLHPAGTEVPPPELGTPAPNPAPVPDDWDKPVSPSKALFDYVPYLHHRAVTSAREREMKPPTEASLRGVLSSLRDDYGVALVLEAVKAIMSWPDPPENVIAAIQGRLKDSKLRRKAGEPPPLAKGPTKSEWDMVVKAYRDHGESFWPGGSYGPPPGKSGCLVPAEIQKKHGFTVHPPFAHDDSPQARRASA